MYKLLLVLCGVDTLADWRRPHSNHYDNHYDNINNLNDNNNLFYRCSISHNSCAEHKQPRNRTRFWYTGINQIETNSINHNIGADDNRCNRGTDYDYHYPQQSARRHAHQTR